MYPQIATLDNWTDIALINMYGCENYGYDSSVTPPRGVDVPTMDPASCRHSAGLGWAASWYFIVFITLSVMILESLFVGIIITAMDLLKVSVKEEEDMWAISNERIEKYHLKATTVTNLLEVFDALDVSKNGMLTV